MTQVLHGRDPRPVEGVGPCGAEEVPTDLAVVTSWRHTEGVWPGRARHVARTVEACERLWPQLPDWQERVERATEVLPAELAQGEWFPRLEARPDGIVVLVRPAPEPRPATRLWTLPGTDPREHPTLKGPDLALQSRLRERSAEQGADDAALCGPDGTLRETAHGTLVWWSGEQLASPPLTSRLASVTEQRLHALAAQRGTAWVTEEVRPQDLAHREVWLLSSLHGISGVTAWSHGSGQVPVAPPTRARAWDEALASMP